MRTILIVDDSHASTRALDVAERRNWPPGTKILVLAVVPRHHLRPPPPPMLSALTGNWRAPTDSTSRARVQVKLAVEALKSCGLDVEGTVRLGRALKEILKVAREWTSDAIMVGASNLSPLRRLFAGRDLAGALAADAPCKIEAIRASQEIASVS